ncbi:MAG TPA: VOC family protein [Candidatus Binatia bacterium]|nr:VOC family protein [Candidatus Binatia bacterium]
MKLKFDCIFYYVSDIERSIRFYTDVLGFKLQSRDFVARFHVDGVLFELVPTTDKTKLGGGGNARLCLEVDNVDEELRELQRRNIPVEPAKSEHGGRLASFRDPDGNEVCLWQYSAAKAS